MKTLKIKGYKIVEQENTIDTFFNSTIDDIKLILEIKDTGNCIISTRNIFLSSTIGWTDDVDLAFDIFNNSVPISTFEEIYNNRK